MSEKADKKPSPEYVLLERIDRRLGSIEDQIEQVETRAIRYGAAAGAATGMVGGLVSAGILIAKLKLGA